MAAIRFGTFEVDSQSGELRRSGRKVRLQEQPLQVLLVLIGRPGEVITREELTQRLWPGGTFVDFERGLNKAVTRLRDALGDSADKPRYVETLPRRGYRFIAPVESAGLSALPEPQMEELPKVQHEPPANRIRLVKGLFAALAVLVASATLVWILGARVGAPPKVVRFRKLTNDGQAKVGPLATDGPRVYFNQVLPGPRAVISQVSIRGGESVPLPLQLSQPMVVDASDDGTELLLANEEADGQSLWIQPVSAGSPRRVGSVLAHDAAFGPGADRIIYGREKDVFSIKPDGAGQQKLATPGQVAFAFDYSPDARSLRFTVFDVQVDDMWIMDSGADGSNSRKIFRGCWGKWTPDGRYFVFQNRSAGRLDFWALRESKIFRWGSQRREPVQLTSGPIDYEFPLPSKDGRTVFALGTTHRAELINYDQHTQKFAPFLAGISAEGVSFSNDGQWVVYTSYPEGDLWRCRIDGTAKRQLTFPPLRAFSPRWSPDGRRIAFTGDLPENATVRNVYLISSEGGVPERVLPSEQSQSDVNWSPDSNRLLFGSLFVPEAPILIFDLRTQNVAVVPGSNGLFNPRWSPDGRMIAAVSTSGPHKLMLFDVAVEKWVETVSLSIGHYPTWSHNAKYLYFQYSRDQDAHPRESIGRVRVADGKIESVVDVESLGRVNTGTFVHWFGLAPDDSLLLARDISTQEIYALDIDWP